MTKVFDDLCEKVLKKIVRNLELEDLANVSDVSRRLRKQAYSEFARKYSNNLISLDATTYVSRDPECNVKPIIHISNAKTWFKIVRNFRKSIKFIRIESEAYQGTPMRSSWIHMVKHFSRYYHQMPLEVLELQDCPSFHMNQPFLNLQQFYGKSHKIAYDVGELMSNLHHLSLSNVSRTLDAHFPNLKSVDLVVRSKIDVSWFISFIVKNPQIQNLYLIVAFHGEENNIRSAIKTQLPKLLISRVTMASDRGHSRFGRLGAFRPYPTRM